MEKGRATGGEKSLGKGRGEEVSSEERWRKKEKEKEREKGRRSPDRGRTIQGI